MSSSNSALKAAHRTHSEFLDDFCVSDDPPEPVNPSGGWTSFLSPSYWARLAEEKIRKLIDRHLLNSEEDSLDSITASTSFSSFPSSHASSSSSSSSSSSTSSSTSYPYSSSSFPNSFLPLSSAVTIPTNTTTSHRRSLSSPSPVGESPRFHLELSESEPVSLRVDTLDEGNNAAATADSGAALGLSTPRKSAHPLIRTGTSWTRLGPYFAGRSRRAVSSSPYPSDTESQLSDSSSQKTYQLENTAEDVTTLDDISEEADGFELTPCPPVLRSSPPTVFEEPRSSPIGSRRRTRSLNKRKKRRSAKPVALRLEMAACTMSDPRKGTQGGEDAFFISRRRNACGVADGVGAWMEQGIDAGIYSRRLASYLKHACEKHKIQDPLEMLQEAYSRISEDDIKGSTTICILSFQPSTSVIHACNLGDSGFLVFRQGQLLLRSSIMQHGPNHPYQLGSNRDTPEDSELIKFSALPGDVVVMGTDGLFDNLHIDEIILFVQSLIRKRHKEKVHPISSFSQELAELLLNAAVEASADPEKYCPFNTNSTQPLGGKLDDITVLIAQVVESYAGSP